MPTAGGLHRALEAGRRIGCDAVQLFTANPRQWNPPPLTDEAVAEFRRAQDETEIPFVVAHDSYLINLCAPDPAVLQRSRSAFRLEIERASQLGIPWVVTHMGSHLQSGEDAGLDLLAESVRWALDATSTIATGVALEITAGQGSSLGYRLEHIARVMSAVGDSNRLGACLDTCHAFAAGYDLRTRDAYDTLVDAIDQQIGLSRLKVIHANDAKKDLGSRVDRHEHIGRGFIGAEPFRWLVTDPRLAHVPVVLETPQAETMHRANLAALRRLLAGGSLAMRISVRWRNDTKTASRWKVVEAFPGTTVAELIVMLDTPPEGPVVGHDEWHTMINDELGQAATVLADGDEVTFVRQSGTA